MNITDQISMTIKFEDMLQVNKKTKFMRRVRLCLELKDNNGFFVYEWQNENKKWEVYAAESMVKIADALNNDQTTVSITSQTRSYDIDLKKLSQKNTSTNVIRKIRCVKSSLLKRCSSDFFRRICLFSGEITSGYINNNDDDDDFEETSFGE